MFPPPIPPASNTIPLVDNPFTPEIFATGVAGLSVINGVVCITVESARCDHSKPQPSLERVVVGRIALSVPAAQTLLTGLYDFMGNHGINPMMSTGTPTCQ